MAPPRPERGAVGAEVPAHPANPATGLYSPPGVCPRIGPGQPPHPRTPAPPHRRAWASNPAHPPRIPRARPPPPGVPRRTPPGDPRRVPWLGASGFCLRYRAFLGCVSVFTCGVVEFSLPPPLPPFVLGLCVLLENFFS